MKFTRLYSIPNIPIENQIVWKKTDSLITDSSGAIIFEMKDIEVPIQWSQTAVNILAQKYFRKAGVPYSTIHRQENGRESEVPIWLRPSIPDTSPTYPSTTEVSAQQVFHRLAGCWTYWGWREGIFDSEESAKIFYDEIYLMLALQIGAPNSPQWFNTGLHWAYGIAGPDSGQWVIDYDYPADGGQVGNLAVQISNSYERPQCHACFIQPVADDLVNPGGIMDLWLREAKIFKHGSGAGTNFSSIRAKGEKLSGGGTSSGLMSFLHIGDRAAGAIKSGGTTRRAALMRVLDIDHPEIEDFINWKSSEEKKAKALVAAGYSEEEALETVSGQNSNNSIRVTVQFMEYAEDEGAEIDLHARSTNETVSTVSAPKLWNQICTAAWECGDPGLHFSDTMNSWHTCKADGDINASNPCSEYLFLDNTACNLASLNLVKFRKEDGEFDIPKFEHAVRLWTTVLEISVYMASFPSKEIALGSHEYRTLGLGYANLGGLLMRSGLAYDSDEGRNVAAAVTALMTGLAYKTSAELAKILYPFPRWNVNRSYMDNVIDKHIEAVVDNLVNYGPSRLIADKAWKVWTDLKYISFRNAQVTVLAPTGTIALLMDCDTTGVEPDFSLVKTKVLAGGGEMKMVNQSVSEALISLGYYVEVSEEIQRKIALGNSLSDAGVERQHWPVFATAVGENAISPEAHVEMVAAVQPFISGGVSKTVNMPNSATIADIDKIYRLAHQLGLKSISVYRDGCKLAQPLSSVRTESARTESDGKFSSAELTSVLEAFGKRYNAPTTTQRKSLPSRRYGYTNKYNINGQTLYLSTGEYKDGALGEIFLTLSKVGSTAEALANSLAKAISIGVQYGVPLEEFVDAFTHTRFEPSGIVHGHETIKMCSSILDLIFRDLAITYLDKAEEETPINYDTVPTTSSRYIETGDLTGDLCWECGQPSLIRTGSCLTCKNCGANSGCG